MFAPLQIPITSASRSDAYEITKNEIQRGLLLAIFSDYGGLQVFNLLQKVWAMVAVIVSAMKDVFL